MLDPGFLKRLADAPGVGTACGPVIRLLDEWFGPAFERTLVPDGFCLYQRKGPGTHRLQSLLVAHLDEVGGCVLGALPPDEGGGYATRLWGNQAEAFLGTPLQAMDWLAEDADEAYAVEAEPRGTDDPPALALQGERIRPFRTVFTFREAARFDGETIEGKALDPRATVYCVAEAVQRADDPRIGALFVMAEECAMDQARKAVVFLSRRCPSLRQIVNADVPEMNNLEGGSLEIPAIRIFEGRGFVDPSYGIRVSEAMLAAGVEHHLTASRTGSQTALFAPLAPTLSVALPSRGIHSARYVMSLSGIARCADLLARLAIYPLQTA
jgi:putative aminopeptidase FrvX